MKETKHTPGPWLTREGFSSDEIEIFAPNPKIKKPFLPTELAVVGFDEDEPAEGKSNARLIAAAPDLLEACQAAKKHLEPDLVEPGRTVFWKLVDAIRKATGETP